jgi:phenylacetic acid degradation operon negative regulatory protein
MNDAEAAAADLPRSRPDEPQHLLATLLGSYAIGREPVPAGVFPRLLAEFGISPASARNALSRVARRGLLEPDGGGRARAYRMTAAAREKQERRTRQFMAFGQPPPAWDGRWTMVLFSLPEHDRTARQALRTRLTRAGFRSLRDGVWATPCDRQAEAAALVGAVAPAPAAVLRAELVTVSASFLDLERMFGLASLRAAYESFIGRFAPLCARAGAVAVPAREALVIRTTLMDEWREFADTDPDLPDQLLPADWPRDRARAVFIELDAALAPLAAEYLNGLLAAGRAS